MQLKLGHPNSEEIQQVKIFDAAWGPYSKFITRIPSKRLHQYVYGQMRRGLEALLGGFAAH